MEKKKTVYPNNEKEYCLWWAKCKWDPKRLEEIKQKRLRGVESCRNGL